MLSGRPIGPVGDRLANAAGWAYETGAEGQRVLKSGGGNYAYLAADATGALMAEDDNGTWFDYVWLNGRLIGLTVNGGVFSLHDDQTGRPLVMTTPNTPTIAWAAVGLPLGHPWVYTNTFGNFNLGFPGQYWDSESGLWHNGNRDYNPYIGRYIESDPIGLAGGINTYAYVADNPISNVDPLGLCPKCTLSQEIAAKLGSFFDAASKVTGAFATTTGALTVAAAGAELPSGGTDTPITAGLAVVTSRAATASVVTGLASAGFNAYASGNMSSFRGFLAGEITSGVVGILASHVPGVSTAATDYLQNAAGLVAGNAVNTPPPCQKP